MPNCSDHPTRRRGLGVGARSLRKLGSLEIFLNAVAPIATIDDVVTGTRLEQRSDLTLLVYLDRACGLKLTRQAHSSRVVPLSTVLNKAKRLIPLMVC